jgi:hypothetical protein
MWGVRWNGMRKRKSLASTVVSYCFIIHPSIHLFLFFSFLPLELKIFIKYKKDSKARVAREIYDGN